MVIYILCGNGWSGVHWDRQRTRRTGCVCFKDFSSQRWGCSGNNRKFKLLTTQLLLLHWHCVPYCENQRYCDTKAEVAMPITWTGLIHDRILATPGSCASTIKHQMYFEMCCQLTEVLVSQADDSLWCQKPVGHFVLVYVWGPSVLPNETTFSPLILAVCFNVN